MTSLNTHIPLEYVKQSKKLKSLKSKKYNCSGEICDERRKDELIYIADEGNNVNLRLNILPIITIADIIDNAESILIPIHKNFNYDPSIIYTVEQIINMCFLDKSIEEISEYILKNIKE